MSRRRQPWRGLAGLPAVLALLALLALPGCGLLTLAHDEILGPVSPAGRIHDVTVGAGFHVTEQGPVADPSGEALLRPYPPDLVERMGAPHSLWSLTQGIEAFIRGFSPVVASDTQEGASAPPEARAALQPGVDLRRVLELLGPPQLWLRRERGSILLYRDRELHQLALYLGVPPLVSALVPAPGIGALRFRYASTDEHSDKLMLFFDADDVLEAVSTDAGPAPARAPEGSGG